MQAFIYPSPIENCNCPICTRAGAVNYVEPVSVFDTYNLQSISQNVGTVANTNELREFEQKHSKHLEWTDYAPGDISSMSWHKACVQLLKKVIRPRQARFFLEPVDWRKGDLQDYPRIIKHPMDLNTIDRRLNDPDDPDRYTNPDDFVSDVRLVFRNAYLFNPQTHPVTVAAQHLSTEFETELQSLGPANLMTLHH